MAAKHLGEVFDIHGGGIDLQFPHHENEIAQSRCANDTDRMASIWMHNGFLQVEGEKMSKSLGNFITIHELLATDKFGGRSWRGDAIRLAMLEDALSPTNRLDRAGPFEAHSEISGWMDRLPLDFQEGNRTYYEEQQAMRHSSKRSSDDLNTPQAIHHHAFAFAKR